MATYPETTKAVTERVAEMQSGSSFGPIVLANRYDGIDLAGDACRFLVMDNLPQGSSNYDVFRMNVVADSAVASLLAQRIEQGIGRGTRGGGDHCVDMLIGSKLVAWIGRKNNLAHLTASTRVQLKMGQEVSEAVANAKEVDQTVLKCLNRDPDWVAYHASELADAAHAAPIDMLALKVAGIERRAFRQQRLGQFENAIQTLEKLIADKELADDAERRAWLQRRPHASPIKSKTKVAARSFKRALTRSTTIIRRRRSGLPTCRVRSRVGSRQRSSVACSSTINAVP
ncbi:hypothetical protein ACF1BQ_029170 [Bradyrhizobium sp. RDT10]